MIEADTMKRALRIGDWSLAQALDVLTGPDPELREALDWLRRNGEAEVSRRDLQRGRSLKTADEAQDLAESLVSLAALRPLDPTPVGKQGGRRAESTLRRPPRPPGSAMSERDQAARLRGKMIPEDGPSDEAMEAFGRAIAQGLRETYPGLDFIPRIRPRDERRKLPSAHDDRDPIPGD